MSKEQSTRVYVGNLGGNGVKSELEREFSKFGPVRDVWVARNPPGFAFVEFEDYRDADDAVRELDGRRVCGVRVRVAISSRQGRTTRQPLPQRGRSQYSPDNRYNAQRNYYRDEYEDKFSRRSPRRQRERSPVMDRFQRRYSRSRSRSPPPRYY